MTIAKISRGKSFRNTISYAFDPKKKPLLVYGNLAEAIAAPDNLKALIKAFNDRARFFDRTDRPVYRIAVSPAPEDRLTPKDWSLLCGELIAWMQLDNHQTIGVLHRDTYFPNTKIVRPHVHLIINAVSNDGKCGDFSWDYRRVENFLRTYEQKHNYTPVISSWERRKIMSDRETKNTSLPTDWVKELANQLELATQESVNKGIRSPTDWAKFVEARVLQPDAILVSYEETKENKPKEFRFTLASDPQKSITGKDLAGAIGKNVDYYSANAIQQRLAQLAKQPQKSLGKTLYEVGEHIDRRTKPNRTELDGITLLTAGANLTGSLIGATGLAAEIIQRARSAAASNDKNIEYLWDDLEQAAQRIDSLQSRLKDVFTVANKTQELPKNLTSVFNSSEEIEDRAELMADSVELISDRLRQLEEALDPTEPVSPLKADRTLPLGEQLKLFKESIDKINERLDGLEQSIAAMSEIYHPIRASDGVVSAERFATTWINFIRARAIATDRDFSGDCELITASGKIVELKHKGNFLRISNPNQKTPLFEADRSGDLWLVNNDHLTPEEVDKILRLPQTAEELVRNAKSIDLVHNLQTMCSEAEWRGGGAFNWRDYYIEISPTSNDGIKTIKSFSDKSIVFEAQIDRNGEIKVLSNEMSYEDLKKIPQPQTNRSKQKQQEPELTL
jgi:hypothetical protein